MTRCPVCGTAGTQFPPAAQFGDDRPAVDVFNPAAASTGMACGPGGCCGSGSCGDPPGDDQGDLDTEALDSESTADWLICPTCDEPFRPQYARRCEWCGHEFADGYETDQRLTSAEAINFRMAGVIVALVALAIAAAVYFLTLV